MRLTRRELVGSAAAAGLALGMPAAICAAAMTPGFRLVDEGHVAAAAGDLTISHGHFIDDHLVDALALGNWSAVLRPANALLLATLLRDRRIAMRQERGTIHFSIAVPPSTRAASFAIPFRPDRGGHPGPGIASWTAKA